MDKSFVATVYAIGIAVFFLVLVIMTIIYIVSRIKHRNDEWYDGSEASYEEEEEEAELYEDDTTMLANAYADRQYATQADSYEGVSDEEYEEEKPDDTRIPEISFDVSDDTYVNTFDEPLPSADQQAGSSAYEQALTPEEQLARIQAETRAQLARQEANANSQADIAPDNIAVEDSAFVDSAFAVSPDDAAEPSNAGDMNPTEASALTQGEAVTEAYTDTAFAAEDMAAEEQPVRAEETAEEQLVRAEELAKEQQARAKAETAREQLARIQAETRAQLARQEAQRAEQLARQEAQKAEQPAGQEAQKAELEQEEIEGFSLNYVAKPEEIVKAVPMSDSKGQTGMLDVAAGVTGMVASGAAELAAGVTGATAGIATGAAGVTGATAGIAAGAAGVTGATAGIAAGAAGVTGATAGIATGAAGVTGATAGIATGAAGTMAAAKDKKAPKKSEFIPAPSGAPRTDRFYWFNKNDVAAKPSYKKDYMYYHYFESADDVLEELLVEMYDCALVRTEEIRYIAYGIAPRAASMKEILSSGNSYYDSQERQKEPSTQDLIKIYDKWCGYVEKLFGIIEFHADSYTVDQIHSMLCEFGKNDVDILIEGM